ncbi:MAG: hypothetical protein FWD08_08075 [Alphaproteobacteria bacterium]|nr:hypothetical protein [Alphaproteobacteria bacterium]
MEESSKMNAGVEPEKVAIGLSQKSHSKLLRIDHDDFGSTRSKIIAIQANVALSRVNARHSDPINSAAGELEQGLLSNDQTGFT